MHREQTPKGDLPSLTDGRRIEIGFSYLDD